MFRNCTWLFLFGRISLFQSTVRQQSADILIDIHDLTNNHNFIFHFFPAPLCFAMLTALSLRLRAVIHLNNVPTMPPALHHHQK
jgi:hypothetical protein